VQAIKNILELREHLAERFPQFRSGAKLGAVQRQPIQASAQSVTEQLLTGELPKITELIQSNPSSGSALLITTLIQRLCAQQWVALIDGSDSFDPAPLVDAVVPKFLWVRCHDAGQALKAADLILRDGNVSIVLLDLVMNTAKELRKIPPPTWYRFQRILQNTATRLVVIVPNHMISCAESRFTLDRTFAFAALAQSHAELLQQLNLVVESKKFMEGAPLAQAS
jgi:hypothetical protein